VEAVVSVQPVGVVDEGLGNTAWLVDLGEGRALVVDPPRDLRAVRAAAARRRLTVVYAADTHLHADFLTGAVQLAADDGAQVLASAAGRRGFAHRGLGDGDEVDLGGLTLRALATPGHTDEHLSFLLLDGPAPVGVFTGGSLIVGSAARTDLLGPGRTQELAHAQYASLHRLAALPDATGVWPTHGAGSFCSAPPGTERASTVGAEKAGNPLLAAPDPDAFVARLLGSLGSYPAYFDRLAELNRRGPAVLGDPPRLAALDVDRTRRLLAGGAVVVDVRPVADTAAGHVPGAVAIPLRDQFATWLGWLVPAGTPVVIVRNPDQDPEDVLWPALNIGVDTIAGELAGGLPAWVAAGHPVATTRLVGPGQVDVPVLDVRQAPEYAAGHLPGATHVELGDLARRAAGLPGGPVVVMCGHGERALSAATLLERAGHTDPRVLLGGPAEWAAATGRALQPGT
jgi:glyoxylase-like metal-dependent hydrolase (beta-lactamase superfamily II)/rhodanese-related sulfurtransferase